MGICQKREYNASVNMFQEKATQWRHKWYITTLVTAWAGTPYALCCWMIPRDVCFCVCLMWRIHPFFPVPSSAGQSDHCRVSWYMTTQLCSAIGWEWHPSLHLPIMLPWRQVGNFEVVAGVRHSVARRKLCVNMGGERCQRPGGKRVRNSVGKCEGKRLCHMNERL